MGINKNFVVKNGFEVSTDLIVVDSNTRKVGIRNTQPQYELDVRGGIGATHVNVSGVGTVNSLVLNGHLSIGNTTGKPNQILVSTGTGVTWSSALRNTSVVTASTGQVNFPFEYLAGTVEVYINGVKLSPNEFVATNGTTVVLDDPCFGNETVEILGSFISDSSPVKIEVIGNAIRFSVVGIGSTTLSLV
jgi:hypothetical protein